MERILKVGQKVRVKPSIKEGEDFAIHVNKKMEAYRGKVVTIKVRYYDHYNNQTRYRIVEDMNRWEWTEDLFKKEILEDFIQLDSLEVS